MVVYVDILLFINTVVNYAVLMTAEKLLKRSSRLYRLLTGAFTGALFSLLIFYTDSSRFLLILLKLLSTAAVTLIVFGWRSKREFGKSYVFCFFISVIYSGFFILFYQLFKPPNMIIINDVVYLQINPLWLLLLTAIIYCILLLLYKLFSERIKGTVVPLTFTVEDQTYSCIGKIDTGCNLCEPFSSAPVIITDPSVFSVSEDHPHRIIPYTALGGSSYLSGVKAQSVLIDKKPVGRDVYIAAGVINSCHYQAIINSELIR